MLWYFRVSFSGNNNKNKRKWPLAFIGLLSLCSIKLVLCQDNSEASGATELNIEAQRREGSAQQSDNGKEIIMSNTT